MMPYVDQFMLDLQWTKLEVEEIYVTLITFLPDVQASGIIKIYIDSRSE